jgi:N6-L-threonylcarbamoyladenine synthase
MVADHRDHPGPVIRSNLIHSQLAEHAPYGGVVPEIAARAHLDHIAGLIGRALAEAGTTVDRLDGVAAAAGPPVAVGVGVRSLMIAN